MSFAQERCGSSAYQEKVQLTYPGSKFLQPPDGTRVTIMVNTEQPATTPIPAERIVIPVVVHVLYRTDNENITNDQILSQLESLNADFNLLNADFKNTPSVFASRAGNANIRFELATVDPDGRSTNGIVRKKTGIQLWTDNDKIKYSGHGGSTAWDSNQYLNIWVGNLVSGLLGYATFPGGEMEKDGIVMRTDVFGTRGRLTAPFNKGRTLTHEIGHWLNLKHLWGDISCGDDGVDDTPRQRSSTKGCPLFPRLNNGCNNGTEGDMFMNFMDFTDDVCMSMFTYGQVKMMRAEFTATGYRKSMLTSKGLEAPWNHSVVSVESPGEIKNIQVYPNPATNSIQINAGAEFSLAGKTYSIFNPSGQVFMSGRLLHQNQTINIQKLPPGLYFIQIEHQVIKWIKSR
jgi:hypothetical protein